MADISGRSYEKAYPRIYKALKEFGFSPFYALRILVDAHRRNDKHVIIVIKIAAGRA